MLPSIIHPSVIPFLLQVGLGVCLAVSSNKKTDTSVSDELFLFEWVDDRFHSFWIPLYQRNETWV